MSAGRLRRLLGAVPVYASIAWWGLVSPRGESRPLRVVWAVIRAPQGLLLSVRGDLAGWELPGGTPHAGEPDEQALRREVREETGLEVEIERLVGDYERTGFRPHTARVFACRVRSGTARPSPETPRVEWFDPARLPDTLFPWYRAPIADALREGEPVLRCERWGPRAILAGLRIDLRMRWRAGPGR